MRFTLFDLILAVATVSLGGIIGAALSEFIGPGSVSSVIGCSVGAMSYFIFTPPIYSYLHRRPLWFPRRPHCCDKNRHYFLPPQIQEWPRDTIICATC